VSSEREREIMGVVSGAESITGGSAGEGCRICERQDGCLCGGGRDISDE
jgi:hypothetical protein